MSDNLYLGTYLISLACLIVIFIFAVIIQDYVSDTYEKVDRIERILTEEGYYEAWSAWKEFEGVE